MLVYRNHFYREAVVKTALSQDTLDVLNVNKQVQNVAKEVIRMVQNELVGAQDQLDELSGATMKAPYAVVQNLEAILPEWLKALQRVQQQGVSAVKLQLDEMALRYEQVDEQAVEQNAGEDGKFDPSKRINVKM